MKKTNHQLLTAKEVGKLLGIGGAAVRAMIRDRKLPAERYGNQWMVNRDDLEKIPYRREDRVEALRKAVSSK